MATKAMTTKTRPAPKVAVRVAVAECEVFASSPMACPLCGVTVPAWTNHTCRKES